MSFLRSTVRGFIALAIATVVLGMVYPCAVWALSRATTHSAEGHLITDGECVVAAEGLADGRTGEEWFHSRPEGMTNLSPLDPGLKEEQEQRRQDIAALEQVSPQDVPADAISGSGSGVDDGISPAYAQLQIPRVARAHGISEEALKDLVKQHTTGRGAGILGDPVVHVTSLNATLPHGTECPSME